MAKRILVARVGYDNLRDLSFGRILIERLRSREWPPAVHVEDLSFGAIVVLHWLQQDPPFDAALFLAGEQRGRTPGSIHDYTWCLESPRHGCAASPEEIQSRVEDAVTGAISLDTLLIVLGHFGALPRHVRVIEVEPRDHEWGLELSPPVARALTDVEAMVRREVDAMLS